MQSEVNRTLSVCQTPAKTRTVTLPVRRLHDFSLLSVSSCFQRLTLRTTVCDAIYASHAVANVQRSSKVSESQNDAWLVCLVCSYLVNVIGHDCWTSNGENDTAPSPGLLRNIATRAVFSSLSSAPWIRELSCIFFSHLNSECWQPELLFIWS